MCGDNEPQGAALGAASPDLERELRIELMQTQIERLRQELKSDQRKFLVQVLIASAALLAAGVAIGRFILFHS